MSKKPVFLILGLLGLMSCIQFSILGSLPLNNSISSERLSTDIVLPNSAYTVKYNFEADTIGANPVGADLMFEENPADGYIQVSNIGGRKCAEIAKTGGTMQVALGDVINPGTNYSKGEIHFKAYHDASGFRVGFHGPSSPLLFQMRWWNGQIAWGETHNVVTTYSYNTWYNVTIYFDMAQGWMFDLNGVRYADGYACGFDSTVQNVSRVYFASFYSSGGNGVFGMDDLGYNNMVAEPIAYIPDSPEIGDIDSPDYDGSYIVLWNSVPGAINYILYRNSAELYNGPNNFYEEIGLSIGTYSYQVVAQNGSGTSGYSNQVIVSVETQPVNVPNETTLAEPSSPDVDGTFALSWASVTGASKYYLLKSITTITNPENVPVIYEGSDLSYSEISLARGTYYYAVIASNSSGNSSISNVVMVEVRNYYPYEVAFTNNTWLCIESGISVVQLTDSLSQVYLEIMLDTSKRVNILLTFYSESLNGLEMVEGLGYWSIIFENPADIWDVSFTLKFYYTSLNVPNNQESNVKLYSHVNSRWDLVSGQILNTAENYVLTSLKMNKFSIKIDPPSENEPGEPGEIPSPDSPFSIGIDAAWIIMSLFVVMPLVLIKKKKFI